LRKERQLGNLGYIFNKKSSFAAVFFGPPPDFKKIHIQGLSVFQTLTILRSVIFYTIVLCQTAIIIDIIIVISKFFFSVLAILVCYLIVLAVIIFVASYFVR